MADAFVPDNSLQEDVDQMATCDLHSIFTSVRTQERSNGMSKEAGHSRTFPNSISLISSMLILGLGGVCLMDSANNRGVSV